MSVEYSDGTLLHKLRKRCLCFLFSLPSSFDLHAFSHHPCKSYNIRVLSDINRFSFTPSAPISFKLACALYSLPVWGQMYSASRLTSSSAAFCFLFPSLIQMTQIWTVSAEHPDSQSIHCSKESLSGRGMRGNIELPSSAIFFRVSGTAVFYYSRGNFWKRDLSVQVGGVCVWSAHCKVTLQWHSPFYHPNDLQ